MAFRDEDLAEVLAAVGGDIEVSLDGAVLGTIKGRIKKGYLESSPFDATAGVPVPILTCRTSDLAGLTNKHIFTDRGTRYRFAKDFQPSDAGFTRVALTVVK